MKKIIIIVAVIIVALIAWGLSQDRTPIDFPGSATDRSIKTVIMEGPGLTAEEDHATQPTTLDLSNNKITVPKSVGTYEAYSANKLALASTGKVVLYFHAPWCPTCRAADADIVKNSANIPVGVHILKTDYDSNTELKKKYGVTYQHTFVQVDEKGNMITKWSGSATLADIVAHVK